MYPLEVFLAVLESLLNTAGQSYQQARETESGPSLAEVLVSRYSYGDLLVLEADTKTWFLTDELGSAYEDRLTVDVPVLIARHFRLITDDCWEPSRVIDIAALRTQMQEEVQLAYCKKYGEVR